MPSDKRITIIVHGPEAVDSGLAIEVIERTARMGRVEARVGGATAVAAVIDAGLEDVISTASKELPSVAITKAVGDSGLILLVNSGKDRSSSLAFGRLVMSRVQAGRTPVVQVDNGLNVIWSGDDEAMIGIRDVLQGEVLDLRGQRPQEGDTDRKLSGVRPGENIWINGHVIGRAVSENVVISQGLEGELMTQGVELKATGIGRLGSFDLRTAVIRSGQVRRTRAKARSLRSLGRSICLIDHCAEESVYRCRDAAYVVTVGDDTSKIASALLYRLGIPVIAITDGDEDGISYEELLYPGSYVFRLLPGNDDQVGAEIARLYFAGGNRIEVKMGIEKMAERVRAACGDRLLWERRF